MFRIGSSGKPKNFPAAQKQIQYPEWREFMLKAVVMDMDGTLLNGENRISPYTKKVLMDLQNKGIRLILASGRSYPRLMDYARELEMDQHDGLLIEIDGVAVYNVQSHDRTKFCVLEPEVIGPVFDWMTEQNAETQAVFDDGMFVFYPDSLLPYKEKYRRENNLPDDFPWTAGPWSWLCDFRKGYPKLSYVKDASGITRDVNKLQIMQEEEPLKKVFEDLQEQFGEEFSIFRTTPRQLEVLPKGIDKGTALKKIMDDNGWGRDEVAVFGDGENDVSMFEQTDLSFAMGNARDYVKDKARFTALDNNHDGIARALVSLG